MILITSKIKTKTTSTIIAAQETMLPNSYQNNGNQAQGNHSMKNNHQEKPVNISVTLNEPVSKEQLYKIQVLCCSLVVVKFKSLY